MVILSVRQRRAAATTAAKLPPLIPLFVAAFAACVAIRSCGILPDTVIAGAKLVQTLLLTAAMFALGTGVQASIIRRVGAGPFVVASAATLWIAALALAGVMLV